MKTPAIIVVVLAVIVVLGGWYAYATYFMPTTPSTGTTVNTNPNGSDYTPATTTSTETNAGLGAEVSVGVTAGSSAPMSATVTLTANGFTPNKVTIKKGGTVTWQNDSTGKMWVASASHPTHTVYSGTTLQQHCGSGDADAFDECGNSAKSYSFTFDKAGTWYYHNHSNAPQTGTVVVVE